MPAERNADNSFGKMPRMGDIVEDGVCSFVVVMRTGMGFSIFWTTRDHDIDVTTVRLSPSPTRKHAS
jgi:hypothetical protein